MSRTKLMEAIPGTPGEMSAGHVSGRNTYHLVRNEPWNYTGLCGVRVYADSLMEEFYSPKEVCRKCLNALENEGGNPNE